MSIYKEDDDDYEFDNLYCNGHWIWDDRKNELKFVRDAMSASLVTSVNLPVAIVGKIEFKEDLDIMEQQRYRKRMQRKASGPDDVVTLQDVKDLVLYCAPASLLSPDVINVLHTTTAERFLRALILYCQYYLQIVHIMERRSFELQNKIPTHYSEIKKVQYQENLNDLRLLVAKEYCTMLLGGGDFRKFHHKGIGKKLKSMSRKEAMIFEPLIRISVQIVWIALARKNYSHIELEINRLFRSNKFNLVEHNLGRDLDADMSPEQRQVLRGQCLTSLPTLNMHSPFFNEVECNREVDFKMMGLGVLKYNKLSHRLQYLEQFLTKPEASFPILNITLGIVGLKRDNFDPVLKEIERPQETDEKKSGSAQSSLKVSVSKPLSKVSTTSGKSTVSAAKKYLYHPLELPEKTTEEQPKDFPSQRQTRLTINTLQHKKWLARVCKKAWRRPSLASLNPI